jgi:D-alanine-D-alanine ligase
MILRQKYTKGMTEYIIPAMIPKEAEGQAEEIALLVYKAFDLSGAARIDMIVEDNTPWIIDINTSPGMTEQSLIPMGWGYSGRGFDELLEEILMEASLKS